MPPKILEIECNHDADTIESFSSHNCGETDRHVMKSKIIVESEKLRRIDSVQQQQEENKGEAFIDKNAHNDVQSKALKCGDSTRRRDKLLNENPKFDFQRLSDFVEVCLVSSSH